MVFQELRVRTVLDACGRDQSARRIDEPQNRVGHAVAGDQEAIS
jgi:hypothetical protein